MLKNWKKIDNDVIADVA